MSKGFHPVTLRWVTEVGETRDMVTLFMRERFRSRSEAWNGFARELGIRSDRPAVRRRGASLGPVRALRIVGARILHRPHDTTAAAEGLAVRCMLQGRHRQPQRWLQPLRRDNMCFLLL